MHAGVARGRALVEWYGAHRRPLPWRKTSDPWRILVSEVMLQQTRAQTVVPYYERFLERFPTARHLAAAPEAEVLALWSGLGYYSRARNLHEAARRIAKEGFPRSYEGIRALPGVGEYTAAAVASIAFGLPHAVVDGNVLRVVARLGNDAAEIRSARTRERFRQAAQRMLEESPGGPGAFNQALMELGATVCLPRVPRCPLCPLAAGCGARRAGTAEQLPVRLRSAEPEKIEMCLLVVRRRGCVLLRRRPLEKPRLAGFWELPAEEDLPGARPGVPLGVFRHSITNHRYVVTVRAAAAAAHAGFQWIPLAELCHMPLTTAARKALKLAGAL